jgi:hypothetical protein
MRRVRWKEERGKKITFSNQKHHFMALLIYFFAAAIVIIAGTVEMLPSHRL